MCLNIMLHSYIHIRLNLLFLKILGCSCFVPGWVQESIDIFRHIEIYSLLFVSLALRYDISY